MRHLRADVFPATVAGTNAKVMFTGQAMASDLADRLMTRLPLFIIAVIAMSFLLLMIVFRSLLVPFKAAVMNLLSIAAAYGVLVAVFQWGWGKGLIGLEHTVPINPFLPLMMFAILFGLSMDYEVFLLSRVREEYVATGDSHQSVVGGLSSTARVITSAALIMISVFGAFVLGGDVNGKMFGIGLVGRRVPRRHARSHGARPRDDEPRRPRQLVAAPLARPHPSAPRPRRRPHRRRRHRRHRARTRRRLSRPASRSCNRERIH